MKGILALETFLSICICLSVFIIVYPFFQCNFNSTHLSEGPFPLEQPVWLGSSHATPLGMHDIIRSLIRIVTNSRLRKFWQPHPVHRNLKEKKSQEQSLAL